jgi:hypothetical protein
MQRRINNLVAYAKTLIDLYLQTHQEVEILESLGTTDLVDRLHDSYGANAFDALVNVLIEDIIRSTWAFALDQAEATPSVVNTWRLVSHAGVLAALRERFVAAQSSDPVQGQERSGDTRTRSQQFDEAVDRLRQTVPAVTVGPQPNKFVKARHKGIAHHEMQRFAGGSPRRFDLRSTEIGWEDLREYVESLAPVVRDLALIITGTDHRIADIHEHHRINVLDFWMRIMGNGSIAPR